MNSSRNFSQKFWEDVQGKVIVWQSPNIWLATWFITMVAGWFLPLGWPQKLLSYVSLLSLIVWAVLELTKGVNYFRRLIGLLVLLLLLAGRFL